MAKLLYLVLFILGFQLMSVAQDKSCCSTDKEVSFVSFSEEKEFLDIHQIPTAFTLENALGTMITFKTKDGKTANGYFSQTQAMQNLMKLL